MDNTRSQEHSVQLWNYHPEESGGYSRSRTDGHANDGLYSWTEPFGGAGVSSAGGLRD